MIRGEPQTVGATITCLVTLGATNIWSVTWSRYFQSVIIAMVMGDMRCVRVVPRNKMSIFLALFDATDNQNRYRGIKYAHFVDRAQAPSIFQEFRDYRRQKSRDQVSDQ